MKSNYKYIPFHMALPLLRPGDVALFRGRSFVSKMIASVTSSPYTHVGIIDPRADGGGADLIEFREFRGARLADFEHEANAINGRVDVFRFPPILHGYSYNIYVGELERYEKEFHGEQVVGTMRQLLGLRYDYRRLVRMYIWKLPFIRALLHFTRRGYSNDAIDDLRLKRFVCSTAVDYSFRKSGFPLIQNKNTNYIEPGDIAQSVNMKYLFTIRNPTKERAQ